MDVFQIHALKEPNVQASQMALGNVENAPQDTLAMESTARISMRCSQYIINISCIPTFLKIIYLNSLCLCSYDYNVVRCKSLIILFLFITV